MRKMLVLLGALVLCAAPAAAQTSGPAAPAETPAAAEVERTQSTPAPSLFPTTDEVKEQVRASEDTRESRNSAMTQRDFLYLVAAIAIGVIIAAVVLD